MKEMMLESCINVLFAYRQTLESGFIGYFISCYVFREVCMYVGVLR